MVKSDDPEKEKTALDSFADDVMSEIESQQNDKGTETNSDQDEG